MSLTAREIAVLEFLVRRTGLVLSKAAILDGVWGEDFDGDPNIVEVYIGRLRRKVDEPFGRHTIVTVRGVGYRIATIMGDRRDAPTMQWGAVAFWAPSGSASHCSRRRSSHSSSSARSLALWRVSSIR